MVSKRLLELVTDPAERSYLSGEDGYWADMVVEELSFLEARGFRIEAIRFHQEGDSITYRGPEGSVEFGFFPDAGDISARASLRTSALRYDGDLDVLARQLHPDMPTPPKLPLHPETISRNVQFWADLLHSVSDTV